MSKIVSVLGVSALLMTVAWGLTLSSPGDRDSGCHSMADANRHLDRSRNGISMTCADFLTSQGKPQVAAGAPAAAGETK